MVDRREFVAGLLSTTGLVAVKGNEQVIPLAECQKMADAGKLTMTVTFDETQMRDIANRVKENIMRDLKSAQRFPR